MPLRPALIARELDLFGDAAMIGRPVAGLPHSWIEPKVAHEFLWRRKPLDVADGRQHADRYDGVYPSNRHQAFDQGFIERPFSREVLFHLSKLCAKTVEFSSMAKDDAALVLGERLSL